VLLPRLAQALPAARLYCEYCCNIHNTLFRNGDVTLKQENRQKQQRHASARAGALTARQLAVSPRSPKKLTFVMCVLPRGLPSTLT
jgi:hypothetical protein